MSSVEPEAGAEKGKLRAFLLVWSGQVVSLVGSGLTSFALGVWVYQRTGSAIQFTLIPTIAAVIGLLLSPWAGALADHWDRRRAMLAANLVAGLRTAIVALLLASGRLEVWHVYVAVGVRAIAESVQYPAYAASVTLLVPRKHLVRANGMVQFGGSAAQVLAPLLAGLLIAMIQLWGVLLIDLATFAVAIVSLLAVRIPQPSQDAGPRPTLFKSAAFGWRYIAERPPLVRLLVFFAVINLMVGFAVVLVTPLVLSFARARELGVVQSVASAGAVIGGLAMSAWGGPRNRMVGMLGAMPLLGVGLMIAGLRPEPLLISAGVFLFYLMVPVVNSCNQAIWQSTVEPKVQGRVFAMRKVLGQGTVPFAYLLAGLLADRLFEPLMAPGGALAGSLGILMGVGKGRGTGLLLCVMGGLLLAASAIALLRPDLRNLERDLMDPASETAAA